MSKKSKRQSKKYNHTHYFALLTGSDFFADFGPPDMSHKERAERMRTAWQDRDVRDLTWQLLRRRHQQGLSLDQDEPAAVRMFEGGSQDD